MQKKIGKNRAIGSGGGGGGRGGLTLDQTYTKIVTSTNFKCYNDFSRKGKCS
ncbi:hypothetical protein PP707_02530 [Acetobacter pasteurianus]|nr:hypothetical protein [Acetobacter pasteurianus]